MTANGAGRRHRGIVKLGRLSRSLTNLLSIVKEIGSKGAQLRSLQDLLIDTTTPSGKLILESLLY
ncbi:MAG: hypothetical protein F4039_04690 [Gammaproteobacteria bacterium]|nr:hypothetical protein [Gammaproteobacteria bacterium]MYF53518.1 hypothetical protein [Gammaproteobacteria bacterium]MYK43368.1 hypothetical protein [Gammaproteobacteria bacterium]